GGDHGIDQVLTEGPEVLERTFLVSSHKPTVANCVGREERRQPSVWQLDRQGFLPDWSRPVYALSCECQGMMKMGWRARPISDSGTFRTWRLRDVRLPEDAEARQAGLTV